jgi:broad specificity phosphatase PhoE
VTPGEAVLVRHAETEWTISGQHTGHTDIPLTERGRLAAAALAPRLAGHEFDLVLVSPSTRALETCELCGLRAGAQVREDLLEWDYGDFEGLTTEEIHRQRPYWNMWRDGSPGGEGVAEVGARADRVIAEIREASRTAVFSHGHMLRVLGARWVELEPGDGSKLALSPGSVSVLGYEHELPIITRWNEMPLASVTS